MLRKKIYKILSIFVAVIIAFCLLCVPVSAATYHEDYTSISSPISQPTVSDNFAYVEVVCRQESPHIIRGYVFLISFYDVSSASSPACRLTFDNNKNIKFWNQSDGIMSVYCVTSSNVYHSQGQAIGESTYLQEFFDFPIVSVKYYGSVYSQQASQYNTSPITTTYGSDNESIILLQTIIEVLRSNSNSVSQQIQNDNANTDKIQQNQNANTDKVIQNQEENQEEIKNGWQQDKDIDTTTTDDYAAKDKELQGATEQGRSETVSVFNSFGSLFQSDGHLYKGLLSVSAMFTEFMKIDWVSSLLNFSLAIGVFAFVIGTGSEIFKSSHEKYNDNKISKIDSYDERWLM